MTENGTVLGKQKQMHFSPSVRERKMHLFFVFLLLP